MAEERNNKAKTIEEPTEEKNSEKNSSAKIAVEKNDEEIRLDKKVTVRSIAPWITGSTRKTSIGDITIPALGTVLLSREEIIAQGQNGNTLITGIDGVGSHATWYIEDEYTRRELSFDIDDKKQDFLMQDTIQKIFELKTQKSFEDNIQKCVVTRAEKFYLLHTIKNLKLNDYAKNAFCEDYCGCRIVDI